MSQKLVFQNLCWWIFSKIYIWKVSKFSMTKLTNVIKINITTAVNANVRELCLFHTRFQFHRSNTYFHKPFYWAFKVFHRLRGYHKIYIITNPSWSHCSTCVELHSVSEVRDQIPLMLVCFLFFFAFPTLLLLTTSTLILLITAFFTSNVLLKVYTQLIP